MKAIYTLFSHLKTLHRVSGNQVLVWTVLAALASLTLSGAEYFIAITLQVLLAKLGLIQKLDEFSVLTGFLASTTLLTMCFFLIGSGLARASASYLAGYSSSATKEHIILRLRRLLFRAELSSENAGDHSEYSSSAEISYQVSDLVPHAGYFILTSVQTFTSFCQVVVLLIALLSISTAQTMVVLVTFAAIAAVTLNISKKVRIVARQQPLAQMSLMNSVQRVTRNRIFLFISKTAEHELQKLDHAAQAYHDTTARVAKYVRILSVIPPFLGVILLTVVIYLSQNYFHSSPQALLPFLYLLLRFSQQTGAVSQQIGQLNGVIPQFSDSMKLAEKCQKKIDLTEAKSEQVQKLRQNKYLELGKAIPGIHIKDLTFGWEDHNLLFNAFNLSVAPGEQIAITGPSGRGKSTLLYLLLGLLRPKNGQITVGGLSPMDYLTNKDSKIGYVGAEPFLMEGTIMENLIYGLEPATVSEADINKALDDAKLSQMIYDLSDGLSHKLNENGEGLSAGQRQRLSLARALIRKPNLLILDEASANLDNDTESQIADTLRELKGHVTTVIVSHRKGLVKYADKIIAL